MTMWVNIIFILLFILN
jgi:hypothetical protein